MGVMRLLASMLRRLVRTGTLTVIAPDGGRTRYGDGGTPFATARIHDPKIVPGLLMRPDPALGEAFMDGRLTLEEGSTLYDFLELAAINQAQQGESRWRRALGIALRGLHQRNDPRRSRRNVAHHYDISNAFYRLFLDADMQYSCAYFRSPDDTLEQAQENKKRHLAAKLLLRPGQRVLDIGSGWGGLALTLASLAEVEVVGVTLSTEQQALATERAKKLGLGHRVRFELKDYRHLKDSFDRIVSVGMFEHVGVSHYDAFFGQVGRLLKPDGVAVLHSIGRMGGPSSTSPWIRRYIFPGGYIPALSEVFPSTERQGLWVTDTEIWRLHYADTLREWRRRFMAEREQVAAMYDERFCRMWEFYLAASEVSFRYGGMMVFQMQLAKAVDTVPRTRDYMVDDERRLDVDSARRHRAEAV